MASLPMIGECLDEAGIAGKPRVEFQVLYTMSSCWEITDAISSNQILIISLEAAQQIFQLEYLRQMMKLL